MPGLSVTTCAVPQRNTNGTPSGTNASPCVSGIACSVARPLKVEPVRIGIGPVRLGIGSATAGRAEPGHAQPRPAENPASTPEPGQGGPPADAGQRRAGPGGRAGQRTAGQLARAGQRRVRPRRVRPAAVAGAGGPRVAAAAALRPRRFGRCGNAGQGARPGYLAPAGAGDGVAAARPATASRRAVQHRADAGALGAARHRADRGGARLRSGRLAASPDAVVVGGRGVRDRCGFRRVAGRDGRAAGHRAARSGHVFAVRLLDRAARFAADPAAQIRVRCPGARPQFRESRLLSARHRDRAPVHGRPADDACLGDVDQRHPARGLYGAGIGRMRGPYFRRPRRPAVRSALGAARRAHARAQPARAVHEPIRVQ